MSLWGSTTPVSTLCIIHFSVIKPDKKFMGMFLGFIDGDGYFDIGEQKQYNKLTKALVFQKVQLEFV